MLYNINAGNERAMKIDITNTVLNPFLKRREVSFRIADESATPERIIVKEKLAAMHNVDFNLVFVHMIGTRFGSRVNAGKAYIYEDEESAKIEPVYIRIRNMKKEERDEARKTLQKPRKKKKKV